MLLKSMTHKLVAHDSFWLAIKFFIYGGTLNLVVFL